MRAVASHCPIAGWNSYSSRCPLLTVRRGSRVRVATQKTTVRRTTPGSGGLDTQRRPLPRCLAVAAITAARRHLGTQRRKRRGRRSKCGGDSGGDGGGSSGSVNSAGERRWRQRRWRRGRRGGAGVTVVAYVGGRMLTGCRRRHPIRRCHPMPHDGRRQLQVQCDEDADHRRAREESTAGEGGGR